MMSRQYSPSRTVNISLNGINIFKWNVKNLGLNIPRKLQNWQFYEKTFDITQNNSLENKEEVIINPNPMEGPCCSIIDCIVFRPCTLGTFPTSLVGTFPISMLGMQLYISCMHIYFEHFCSNFSNVRYKYAKRRGTREIYSDDTSNLGWFWADL
jgi:hypothetical protein